MAEVNTKQRRDQRSNDAEKEVRKEASRMLSGKAFNIVGPSNVRLLKCVNFYLCKDSWSGKKPFVCSEKLCKSIKVNGVAPDPALPEMELYELQVCSQIFTIKYMYCKWLEVTSDVGVSLPVKPP